MAPLVESFRRRPFAWFLVIAFGFTWSLLPLASRFLPASLIALCGPAVAALVVISAAHPAERRNFFSRLTRWRVAPGWYLLALALPLPVSLFRSGVEYASVGGRIELIPLSVLGAIVFVLVAGEEIGWRGFALPNLMARFGPWSSSVILGVVWALWHLPLFFMPGMPQYQMPLAAFTIYTVALSVILTVLAQRTCGSAVIATLFHGAVNTFGWINPTADATLRGWTNALCYGLAAALIGSVAWTPRRPADSGV